MAVGVLMIVGSGNSGSTVLDMSLGRRDGMFSAGEFNRIVDHLAEDGTCCCAKPFSQCETWQSILAQPTGEKARIGDSLALAEAVQVNNPDIDWVVDSSKNWDRALNHYRRAPDRVRLLHLTRDGRGVVYSRLKRVIREPGVLIEKWAAVNRGIRDDMADLGDAARHVTYERFCADPSGVLAAVFHWLGIPALPPERHNRTTHNLAGNPKRFTFHKRIRLDDVWKREMDEAFFAQFHALAGALNQGFLDDPDAL